MDFFRTGDTLNSCSLLTTLPLKVIIPRFLQKAALAPACLLIIP